MTDESNSSAKNENLIVESNDKRDGEFGESGSITKKPRTNPFDCQEQPRPETSDEGTEKSNQNGYSEHKEQNQAVREVGFEIEAEAAEDKGSRHAMEDAWVVLPDACLDFPGKLRCAHYAIYDGHGGRLAAEYAQKHLHINVLSAGLPRELLDVKAAKRAILEGFRKTDEYLLQHSAAGIVRFAFCKVKNSLECMTVASLHKHHRRQSGAVAQAFFFLLSLHPPFQNFIKLRTVWHHPLDFKDHQKQTPQLPSYLTMNMRMIYCLFCFMEQSDSVNQNIASPHQIITSRDRFQRCFPNKECHFRWDTDFPSSSDGKDALSLTLIKE
ncbi:protein phosphatase 2C family protein [Actinidia rufa]|uniref:Protein phosphatase 2C family protein n=1 Tax=Actinidia rufa TaxID=165716 RepID=A0A7J0DFU3_9ERIC|nr:protein phosphatase 2C family protein [Actinidia rufa]